MNKKKIRMLTESAVIASLYVALTLVSAMLGLSSGVIQLRLSEALCTLAYLTPAAVPGLFVGCFISNMLTGGVVLDVLLGSLATLAGAVGARILRKLSPYLSPLPTIIANIAAVPVILKYGYGIGDSVFFLIITVGIGEFICSGVLGLVLLFSAEKTGIFDLPEK